jgi:hypothetical protein
MLTQHTCLQAKWLLLVLLLLALLASSVTVLPLAAWPQRRQLPPQPVSEVCWAQP